MKVEVIEERIKSDPEAQALENVACLVFLEFYFDSFVKEHAGDEEKIVTILRRTWKKMSPQGREAAMTLTFSDEAKTLIGQALAG